MRRPTILALPAVLALAGALACGGGEERNDPDDIPGVDASGTADTELFTKDPGSGDGSVPVTEAEGGTPIDSVPLGTPGTDVQDSTVVQPVPRP